MCVLLDNQIFATEDFMCLGDTIFIPAYTILKRSPTDIYAGVSKKQNKKHDQNQQKELPAANSSHFFHKSKLYCILQHKLQLKLQQLDQQWQSINAMVEIALRRRQW